MHSPRNKIQHIQNNYNQHIQKNYIYTNMNTLEMSQHCIKIWTHTNLSTCATFYNEKNKNNCKPKKNYT